MALGLTQRLTEISTKGLPGSKARLARKADNLTTICETIFLENAESWTSRNRMGLHSLLQI
jgi:hypothetical protein